MILTMQHNLIQFHILRLVYDRVNRDSKPVHLKFETANFGNVEERQKTQLQVPPIVIQVTRPIFLMQDGDLTKHQTDIETGLVIHIYNSEYVCLLHRQVILGKWLHGIMTTAVCAKDTKVFPEVQDPIRKGVSCPLPPSFFPSGSFRLLLLPIHLSRGCYVVVSTSTVCVIPLPTISI
jgi:hypothetical protein